MDKSFLLILAMLFSVSVMGQQSSCKKTCCSKGEPTLETLDKNLQVVFVINEEHHKVKDISKYDIDSEWVDSISILKDAKSKETWNNDQGVAFLYVKEEYSKKLLRQVKKLE